MQRVISKKIKQHNEKIVALCSIGKKSLIKDYFDPVKMSLSKIQVELSLIQ
jgi:hypothetical protein